MLTIRLLVAALMLSTGCRALFQTAEEKRAMAEESARQRQEHQRWEQERQRKEQERLAQEAEYDSMCLEPKTTYQVNWCLERQRQKDRAYAEAVQQRQWDHEEKVQREQTVREDERARRERMRKALDAFSRPDPPKRSIDCTTRPDYAGGTTTHCD